MKKLILSLIMLGATNIAFSQVGVDTETPTETLHVQGEVRIDNLPNEDQTNAIYTDPSGTRSSAKDQTFKPTRTVVADDNGVLGSLPANPILSQTTCYASTTRDFSELNGAPVLLYEIGNAKFRYSVNPTAGSDNDIQVYFDFGQDFRGISKGDHDIGGSYFDIPNNTWTSLSTNINWDTERYGELLFFTDVDALDTVNDPQLFYKIIYYTQKRTGSSYPSFCFEIIQISQ